MPSKPTQKRCTPRRVPALCRASESTDHRLECRARAKEKSQVAGSCAFMIRIIAISYASQLSCSSSNVFQSPYKCFWSLRMLEGWRPFKVRLELLKPEPEVAMQSLSPFCRRPSWCEASLCSPINSIQKERFQSDLMQFDVIRNCCTVFRFILCFRMNMSP